jgi:acetyl esterase/lipase
MYKLWENGTPYFNPGFGQPEPTLTPYLSDTGRRGCVIVAPGGGYGGRAPHEGEPISKMINEAGIHSFVLNYRVAPYKHPAMLEDVLRAVRYVRFHAGKFNIYPEKIGILGFSAGGHLAVTAVEHFDYGKNGDEIDAVSSRPDAGILCYPVVSLKKYGHEGTKENLLGKNADPELVDKLSGELSVRGDMPPIFIWHTFEDDGVHIRNSLDLAAALKEKNIPTEMHIFPYGVHGLGLAESNANVAQWAKLLQNWLLMYNF